MINYNNIDKTIFYKVFWLNWLNRYNWINWNINIFEKIDCNWKKTYKLVLFNWIIFNWIWKNKAIKILNQWLNYMKKENFNYTINWLINSMIF